MRNIFMIVIMMTAIQTQAQSLVICPESASVEYGSIEVVSDQLAFQFKDELLLPDSFLSHIHKVEDSNEVNARVMFHRKVEQFVKERVMAFQGRRIDLTQVEADSGMFCQFEGLLDPDQFGIPVKASIYTHTQRFYIPFLGYPEEGQTAKVLEVKYPLSLRSIASQFPSVFNFPSEAFVYLYFWVDDVHNKGVSTVAFDNIALIAKYGLSNIPGREHIFFSPIGVGRENTTMISVRPEFEL